MKLKEVFTNFATVAIFWFKRNRKFLFLALVAVVLFIFALLYKTQSSGPVTVSGFFPANGSTDVDRNSSATIYFKFDVPEQERAGFYIRFLPGVAFDSTWVSSRELKITPKTALFSGVTYKVEISYKSKLLTGFSFTIQRTLGEKQIENISEEDLKWMNESAQQVNESIDALKEAHFWYFNLPVLTDNYALLFDNKKNQFRVSLFTKTGMSEDEKKKLLDAAVAQLTNIVGVDAIKYGYYVIYRENYVPPIRYSN